ncbi:hypothetical protein AMJ83_10260 [candidate division WOR_3 bacterium SM23_42]|uniref:Uncharacterized protein n=1 Tax=candidate division WOR_3 bacterium SM23_42 TaxID=1703779 RepID=A0A0S8FPG4_UNCW3|nr:MAG: hypothetical protein AMJ83_10260 [candidate division WOR_3 bacterium SM23_42]
MDLKGEFISKAAEIAVGVVVGYISYAVSAPTSDLAGMFGIMTGLTTTLIVALLVESYRHSQDLKKTNTLLANLLSNIAEQHEKTSDLAQLLRYGVTRIPGDQLIEGLVQFLWRVEYGLSATNYVHPDEGWGRAYSELYHEIQRTKIKVNKATIRRVFIVDDENEVNTLRTVMSRQKQVGIHVKYIFRKKIESTSLLKIAADTLDTLDFDIIDHKFVWLTLLDANRKIKEGKVLFGREECDKYKRFHDNLFAEAQDIDF